MNRIAMWRSAVLAGAVVLALAACALAPVDTSYRLNGQSSDGVVYFSLTRVGSVEPSIRLKLRGINNSYSTNVALDDFDVRRDWSKVAYESNNPQSVGFATAQEPIGYVAAFALPAGEYEFYGMNGESPIWRQVGDDYNLKSQAFSVRFTVQAGKLTYAGNLQVTVPNRIVPEWQKYQFELSLSDQRARDEAVLRQKYPRLAEQQAVAMVMTSPNTGKPLDFWTFPTTGPTRNGGGTFD